MFKPILRTFILAGACALSTAAMAAGPGVEGAQAAPEAAVKPQQRDQSRETMTETERQEIRQEQYESSERRERDADEGMRGDMGSSGRHEDRPAMGPGGRGMGLGTGRASDSETRTR